MDATFQLSSWIGWVKEIPEKLIKIRQQNIKPEFTERILSKFDVK